MSRKRVCAFALLLLTLAACGGGNTVASREGAAALGATTALQRAFASLTHTPRGTVTLTWRPDDRSLAVALDLYGFAPNSTHPAHIHLGRCDASGPVQYDLGALAADAQGRITRTLTQPGIEGGVPQHGWYLDLQNAVGDDTYSLIALACVDIERAEADPTRQQVIQTSVTSGVGPSMNVSGQATLEIEGDKLVVVVTLTGLEAGSTHPLFVQQGDCAHLGAGVFSLYPIQADSRGRAKNKQSLQGVTSMPGEGWSLVVLRGVHLQSQIDAAPISCGAIMPVQQT